jgi:hypothetical protein
MATPLRAIETDQYRLVHYTLESGDEYFTVCEDVAPEVLRTSAQNVMLTTHSTINSYKDVGSGLVFLSAKPAGLTVVQQDRATSPKVFLFKQRLASDKLSVAPVPLVAPGTPAADIQLLADQIRLITSQRRLAALDDFGYVTGALNRAVTKTAQQAEAAVRVADESLSFLLRNLHTLPDDPQYVNIRQTTLEQMRIKLDAYNTLTGLVDRLLDQRQEIEQLTRRLQESIRPITQISQEMPLVS